MVLGARASLSHGCRYTCTGLLQGLVRARRWQQAVEELQQLLQRGERSVMVIAMVCHG